MLPHSEVAKRIEPVSVESARASPCRCGKWTRHWVQGVLGRKGSVGCAADLNACVDRRTRRDVRALLLKFPVLVACTESLAPRPSLAGSVGTVAGADNRISLVCLARSARIRLHASDICCLGGMVISQMPGASPAPG